MPQGLTQDFHVSSGSKSFLGAICYSLGPLLGSLYGLVLESLYFFPLLQQTIQMSLHSQSVSQPDSGHKYQLIFVSFFPAVV